MIQDSPAFKSYVCHEGDKKVLYLQLNKALYGCLRSASLFWERLSGYLTKMGFTLNPYDECVANMIINGQQCTITWHVDDLKISHVEKTVVSSVISKIEQEFGSMSVTRGNLHTYVGMDIKYMSDGAVTISVNDYLHEAIDDFPEDINVKATTPAAMHLFEISDKSEIFPPYKREVFHSIVDKLLFAGKRGSPDIMLTVAFLSTRVQKADCDDWEKLYRLLCYVKATLDLFLTLRANDMSIFSWWSDASYSPHGDCKSHTGGCGTLGSGMFFSKSIKQKLNTCSSTEAELVAAHDILPQIL